ncbi:NAD(P)-dependent oxidoreductase [Marinibacterium sp. SX1]|uniref:NAD(P)-dependent oxidoreductase n=1 Tax=Marinibacterium sp. SX1 TaxID=3388424 RepID=UPI003D1819DA
MKILVIGATGMVGSRVVAEALSRGHAVIGAARTPSKLAEAPGLEPLELEVTDGDAVARAAGAADLIVGAVSPRSTGDAASEMAAIMAGYIAGAEGAGKRLIVVGGAGTLNLPDGTPVADVVPEAYAAEARAMRAAYGLLEASSADYTFLAPPGEIAPGTRSGQYRTSDRTYLADAEGNSRISAEDFAVALLDEAETPAHRGEIFTVAY